MPQELLTYAILNHAVIKHVLWRLEHDGIIKTYSLYPQRALVWVAPEHKAHVHAEMVSEQSAYVAR